MFSVYVHTYEEGGRVLINRELDLEDTLSVLYCKGLGDQIGAFMLSRYEDAEDSWTFTTDPWTIVISELDGSEVMDV
jgi:hypothetical protein